MKQSEPRLTDSDPASISTLKDSGKALPYSSPTEIWRDDPPVECCRLGRLIGTPSIYASIYVYSRESRPDRPSIQ